MSSETKEAILYGQLQEGLRLELLRGPAVSGALGYKELCVAAKGEERRLLELKKRQAYLRQGNSQPGNIPKPTTTNQPPAKRAENGKSNPQACYHCGKLGHIAQDCCKKKSSESPARPAANGKEGGTAGTRRVDAAGAEKSEQETSGDPLAYLYSSNESDEVRQVCVPDRGSRPRRATVTIQDVPAQGLIDIGADITIMGGDLFKKVASVARLHKRDFKRPDKVPVTYNNQQFQLNIAFGETTIRTPVYLKMDAQEQLLLSEDVCSQLGLVTYHPGVASTHIQDSATEDGGQTESTQIPVVSAATTDNICFATQ